MNAASIYYGMHYSWCHSELKRSKRLRPRAWQS